MGVYHFVCSSVQGLFFTFTVPHLVEIRDVRLGLLQWLCFVAVVVYIIGWQVLLNNQYLQMYPAQGILAFSFQQMRQSQPPPVPWYPSMSCSLVSNTCFNYIKPKSALPYCCNSSCTFGTSIPNNTNPDLCVCPWTVPGLPYLFNCLFDDVYAVGNSKTPSRLFVATHRYNTIQTYNTSCYTVDKCPKPWLTSDIKRLYVAGVEDYIVKMDHTLLQESLGIAVSANQMNGAMFVEGTNSLQNALCANPPAGVAYKYHPDVSLETTNTAPCMIPPDYTFVGTSGTVPAGNNTDAFYLRTVLAAAGVTLDDSGARYNGGTLDLTVVYSNVYGQLAGTGLPRFGVQDPFYFYRVRAAFTSGYQDNSVTYLNRTTRMLESPYGLAVNVNAEGTYGQFNFLTLTQVLVTGLALTSVGAVVVKLVATHCLRRSPYYKRLMQAYAFDFEGHDVLEKLSDAELDEELQLRSLPPTEDRTVKILRLLQAWHYEKQKLYESGVQAAVQEPQQPQAVAPYYGDFAPGRVSM